MPAHFNTLSTVLGSAETYQRRTSIIPTKIAIPRRKAANNGSASLDLVGDLPNLAAALPGQIFQRPPAAGGEYRHRAEQLLEGAGGAGIETAIGAVGQAGDLPEGKSGERVVSLVEHERRHAENAELAGKRSEGIDIFLDAVADDLFQQFSRDAAASGGDLGVPPRSTLMALALEEVCRRAMATDTSCTTLRLP